MATITTPRTVAPPDAFRPTRRAKRRWPAILTLGVVFATAAGGAAWTLRGANLADSPFLSELQTVKVRKGLLRVTVNDDGNVESASNVDVKCEVEGGSQILWIIGEGAEVKKGDELVRLDSSKIQVEITQQRILYERAAADLVKAKEDLSVAAIAVKEYEEGTFKQELQTADANVVIARENLKSSQNLLEHNERMFRKGYINRLQLETSEFAVERNKLELAAMETARQVLLEFTKPKMLKELLSVREAAQANVAAMQAAADLEKSKLDRLEDQLAKCIVRAPQSGMVVYANQRDGRSRSESTIVEEGALVRQFQSLIWLPDLTNMQVKTLIHETKIDKVRVGMPAVIRIRGNELHGRVTNVKNQPEPSSWFSMDVKEYAALVSIDDQRTREILKPGMTAEVEIVVREIPDALQIPLLGLVQEGSEFVCYVVQKSPPGYERRVVSPGEANTSFIEIKEGLEKGEEVILNPRASVAEAARRAGDMERQRQRSMQQRARESQSQEPEAVRKGPGALTGDARSPAGKSGAKAQRPAADTPAATVGGGGDGQNEPAEEKPGKAVESTQSSS